MKRRNFIKAGSGGLISAVLLPSVLLAKEESVQAVWVENGDPAQLLKAALKELGGIGQFISKGDIVVVKPNIGWDRAPQYAANTNPELVRALITVCYEAGAKTVKLFDRTCNNPRRCYRNSQIESVAREAGADVSHIRENRFIDLKIEDGEILDKWSVYRDYIEADKIINVPIAKHHSLSRVSLGLKNLMGVLGGNRGSLHSYFDTKIIDIDRMILPHLTIIDAYRMLTSNGPSGGNIADVKLTKTLIASPCLVTADYLTLELFGHSLNDVRHIKAAYERGLNRFDYKSLNLKKVRLSV
jgi:uncharacterized protein (DUF362 family)